ncbi:MAG: class I SAM-dependent methyltransferase [Ignavibacteria bacterium]|nr:class I SAM-dependent methyltransferase [Ignavibacteria bacterium]
MIHYGSINFKDRILDVGCGNGSLLKDFLRYGFKNLTGIDPFLKMETKEDNIRLLKKNLFEEEETYDVIIFNHSFEHIWEQRRTLIKSSELLSEKGCLIIRMPVVNYAFEKYRENWIQIDAPRHFFVHSLKSFEILCKTCNLKTDKIIFDSTEFQFIASEQLKMGIFLTSHNSYYTDQSNCQFTQDELKSFRHLTRKLNKKYLGDQAVFFIRKVS